MATKLVRKPTTTKTSVGKETVNQTVARAKAMLGSAYDPNTKAPSASRMKEISEQSFIKPEVKKAYDKSVSAMALANTDSPVLPSPTVASTPGLNLAVTNASMGQTDPTGNFVIPEMGLSEGAGASEKAAVDAVNAQGKQMLSYLGLAKPEEGAFDKARADSERQAGVQAATEERNRYQNQINAITSQRDAQILSLEGQGRGQTTQFLGGEQARISREAAITALPIQAQLAAAQGNLEQAKELMGQLYQAKSADIQADMAYRTNLVNSLISFASSSQQTVLQAKLADNAQAAQTAQANLAYQRQLGLQALEYGQTGLITGISAIDPKSPTFEQDMARFTAQLRKPIVGGTSGFEAPTVKTINGVDMQWNPTTGQWETIGGAGTPGAQDPVQKSIDQLSFLRNTAKDALANAEDSGLFRTPVGPSLVSRLVGDTFIGNTSFRQLQNQTDTLKTNVLSLMTDPNVKKFFGPQMSNADVRLMSSTGSTLDPQTQSKKEYIAEIKRLEDLFNRMETAVKTGIANETGVAGGNVITAPDGTLIEIIQ